MKINRISWQAASLSGALLLILSLASCSQNDDNASDTLGNAVNFNAGINDITALPSQTRTTDNGESWTTTDEVGIFMLTTGGNLSTDIITNAGTTANNVQYNVTNATTGALTSASGTTLYYPQSGNVDFIAYYPYGTITAGNKYNISVNGQTDETAQNTLDVLYAKKTNVAKTSTAVALTFNHVLSKVTLNITLGEGLTSSSSDDITAAVLSGMPQTAQLTLQDGTLTAGAIGDFPALKTTTTATYDATFTALLVPQPAGGSSRKALITVNGEAYTWSISDADVFAPGNHYTYKLTVQKNGIVVASDPAIIPWKPNTNNSGTVEEVGKDIEKVKILAAGKVWRMGSSDGSNIGDGNGSGLNITPKEPDRFYDETQHWVMLTKDFYMSKYQITNAQYAAFLNAKGVEYETGINNGYHSGDGGRCNEGVNRGNVMVFTNELGITYKNDIWEAQTRFKDHPVVNVTWYGAIEYANWVGGTLPTEAQWEYACRGGKENEPFGVGGGYKLNSQLAGFDWSLSWSWNGIDSSADRPDTGFLGTTLKVGSYSANAWELYDMNGNVQEWCLDKYTLYPTTTSENNPVIDPFEQSGFDYTMRGGDWTSSAVFCRSASRQHSITGFTNYSYGFRVIFIP